MYNARKSKNIKEIENFFNKKLIKNNNIEEKMQILNKISHNQLKIDNYVIIYNNIEYDFSNQQIYWIYVKKNGVKIVQPHTKNRPCNIYNSKTTGT